MHQVGWYRRFEVFLKIYFCVQYITCIWLSARRLYFERFYFYFNGSFVNTTNDDTQYTYYVHFNRRFIMSLYSYLILTVDIYVHIVLQKVHIVNHQFHLILFFVFFLTLLLSSI